MFNVMLKCVRVTVFAFEKQGIFHVLPVCL